MHVPFRNGGRNHAIARNHPLAEPYRHRLGRETGMVSGLFDPDREVVQLHLRSDVIERLMCQSEIPIGAVQRAHGIEFTQYFADVLRRLESLQDDDLVWIEPERIVVTLHGRRLLRVIAMCFDAYLQPHAAPNGLSLAGQRLVRRRAQYLQCLFDALVDSGPPSNLRLGKTGS